MAAAIRQDDDCIRHDLNPLLCLCDLYVCSVPARIRRASVQNLLALRRYHMVSFYQNALPNEPQPSIMVVLIVFGRDFLKTTCEANHDWFRIERNEDCR